VTGPGGANGRIDIDGAGAISGVLGGRRVRVRAPAASAARAARARGLLAVPRTGNPGLRSLG
jgi:hypothetical protein